MPTDSPEKFRDSLSLHCVAEALAKSLKAKLPKSPKRFCLGAHIRHAFDTTSPTVYICSSNDIRAKEIRQANESHGKQTLNHVLDALLDLNSGAGVAPVAACVTVEFKGKLDPLYHPFDCKRADVQRKLSSDFSTSLVSFAGQKKVCAARCDSGAIRHYPPRPEDYLCGTAKLCEQMEIAVTPMALGAIWSAVVQLGRFTGEDFGHHTVTCMLRGADPFGFVVGFTLITCVPIMIAELRDALLFLENVHMELNTPRIALPGIELSDQSREVLHRIESFRGMDQKIERRGQFIPAAILKRLVDDIVGFMGNTSVAYAFKSESNGILASIRTFLYLASQFCDEKSEGRQLQFGLVHGNPSLLFHWDGPSPIPLAADNLFFRLRDLPKQFHLIEDPEGRCLVIPYLPPAPDTHDSPRGDPFPWEIKRGSSVPAFALELRHFKQAFSEADIIQLWSEEFRPYAYFTSRHRWAIACVVGPYSEIRVFTAGRLSAYRDGKGWKALRAESASDTSLHPWEQIEKKCPQWSGKRILRVLVELAIQLSPIANRHAKGGMLLYSPVTHDINQPHATNDGPNIWFDEKGQRILQDLRAREPSPLPHEGGGQWLTGRVLLPRVNGPPDEEVVHRMLRACSQDGAVIISGEQGVVQAFAKRVNPPSVAGDKSSSGTKHHTARAFVSMVANGLISEADQYLGLSIAVSSDGPITITTVKRLEKNETKNEFEPVETVLFGTYEEIDAN